MNRQPVSVGSMFHKAGRPGILWMVERYSSDLRIAHVVLTRADDPTTKITISADTLSNPLYFSRSTASPSNANGLLRNGGEQHPDFLYSPPIPREGA